MTQRYAEPDRADDVLAGVLPGLEPALEECPCGCGEMTGGPVDDLPLPAVRPAPGEVLASLARDSALVRRAVALATWLGAGRPVTASGHLEPQDAAAAVAELGLAVRVLAGAAGTAGPPGTPGGAASGSGSAASTLGPLWEAAIEAGLVVLADGTAGPGPGLAVWQDTPADPSAQIQGWATLLGGYLAALGDVAQSAVETSDDEGEERRAELEQVLPLALYVAAREPVTVGALSTMLLPPDGYEDDDGLTALLDLPPLTDRVAQWIEYWAVAGMVVVVADGEIADRRHPYADLEALFDDSNPGITSRGREMARRLRPTIDAGKRGPAVRLTPLGSYGLGRLLAANGYDVPVLGTAVDLAPEALLDHLVDYLADDLIDEATIWIDAQGDAWEAVLREVARSALAADEAGPPRREVLAGVLAAADARVEPLLRELEAEPLLTVPVAQARWLLDLGPELTPAQELWGHCDALSMLLSEEDALELALDDTELPDLLRSILSEPGGEAVLLATGHPKARDVLWMVARHLGDASLARRLRDALGGSARGGERRPARRAGGRTGRGRASGEKRGSGKRR